MVIAGSSLRYREYSYRPRSKKVRSKEEMDFICPFCGKNKHAPECENRSDAPIYRAKSKLREIIDSNSWAYMNNLGKKIPPLLLTLTFKENVTDLKHANREFSKFIQRFNLLLFKSKSVQLRYVAVPQFQERGALHYHVVLFNMPYIKEGVYTKIREAWGLGSQVNMKNIRSPYEIHRYLSRYMQKNFNDGRLMGKKKYFASRTLKRPLVVRDPADVEMLRLALPHRFLKRHGYFPTDYCGTIYFENYFLPEKQSVFDLPLDPELRKRIESMQT